HFQIPYMAFHKLLGNDFVATVCDLHFHGCTCQFKELLQFIGFTRCSCHVPGPRNEQYTAAEQDVPLSQLTPVGRMHEHCPGNRKIMIEQKMGCHVCAVGVAYIDRFRHVQSI